MKPTAGFPFAFAIVFAIFPVTARSATQVALWNFNGGRDPYTNNAPNPAYPGFELAPGGGVTIGSTSARGWEAEFHGGNYPLADPCILSNPSLDRLDTVAAPTGAFFNGGFSVMGWYNIHNPSNPAPILSHDSSSCGSLEGFALGFDSVGVNSTIELLLRDGSGALRAIADGTPLNTNQWYHIAVTWNGSASDDAFTFYIGGQKIPSHIIRDGNFTALQGGALPVRIGATQGDAAHHVYAFDGAINHLSLSLGVLTAAEVQTDHVATLRTRLSIGLSCVELYWDTVTNVVYQLQYSPGLPTPGGWISVGGPVMGTGSRYYTSDAVIPGQPSKLYRVIVTNAP